MSLLNYKRVNQQSNNLLFRKGDTNGVYTFEAYLGLPVFGQRFVHELELVPSKEKGQKIVDGNAFMPHFGNLEREEPCSVWGLFVLL